LTAGSLILGVDNNTLKLRNVASLQNYLKKRVDGKNKKRKNAITQIKGQNRASL